MTRSITASEFATLFLIATVLAGTMGVLVLCFLIWLSYSRVALDLLGKHGISESEISRLGGLGIFLAISCYLLVDYLLGGNIIFLSVSKEVEYSHKVIFFALSIGVIGFVDDVKSLHARLRMCVFFVVAFSGFILQPELIPSRFPLEAFGPGFDNKILLLVLGVLVLVGFVNAGNMADGANGLLALIALAYFLCVYLQTGEFFFLLLALSLAVFAVVNMLWGRIILGDFGAYTISALIVLTSFDLFNNTDVSIWFFGSLLSYPCYEICRVILERLARGKSPLQGDNLHLHNKVYELISELGFSPMISNSLTGGFLAFVSSFIPMLLCVLDYFQFIVFVDWFSIFGLQFFSLALLTFLVTFAHKRL